jgi:hypothetical protein
VNPLQRWPANWRYSGFGVGKHQWQHYLPQVYLAGFGTPTGEVWRYDRVGGALKALGTPVIGAEKDLYSLITGQQLSHEIETRWFNPLDGRFGPVLRKLENCAQISPAELRDLANFVAYLCVRTPSKIRETETSFRQLDVFLGPGREGITYHSRPADCFPETYVMSEERCEDVSTRRAAEDQRNEALKTLVSTGMQLARALLDLEWTILIAPLRRSFVIGDNPFAIVPPESHDVNIEGVGPMTPGAAVFVPLSSRICLRTTNTRKPALGHRNVDGLAVRAINSCQVLNSERYLFSQSDALLKRLVGDLATVPGLNLGEVVLREAPSVSDKSRSLLHFFTKSKIGPEWMRKVPMV